MQKIYGLFFILLSFAVFAQEREVALTIDDLPLVGSRMDTPGNRQRSTERFARMVQVLKENNVPAVGFVIGGAIEKGQWQFLEDFKNAGLTIGNHTYSHLSLNQMNADKYIADIARADKVLSPLMQGEPKYFRYPYLAEGNRTSKPIVVEYLNNNHYVIAPVTIDSKDFRFNEELYHVPYRAREQYINSKMKQRYLSYIWQQTLRAEKKANGKPVKQILLIHANLLNSYLLDEVIEMYKQNGYKFITLTEALKNPAPVINYPAAPLEDNAGQKLQDRLLPVTH
jgi:peptidoglycan/xylan/chitin deacetylase (PgdA/CDA1 family)